MIIYTLIRDKLQGKTRIRCRYIYQKIQKIKRLQADCSTASIFLSRRKIFSENASFVFAGAANQLAAFIPLQAAAGTWVAIQHGHIYRTDGT